MSLTFTHCVWGLLFIYEEERKRDLIICCFENSVECALYYIRI